MIVSETVALGYMRPGLYKSTRHVKLNVKIIRPVCDTYSVPDNDHFMTPVGREENICSRSSEPETEISFA
jgi:hypothetical protein